jgi:hypothetical protein
LWNRDNIFVKNIENCVHKVQSQDVDHRIFDFIKGCDREDDQDAAIGHFAHFKEEPHNQIKRKQEWDFCEYFFFAKGCNRGNREICKICMRPRERTESVGKSKTGIQEYVFLGHGNWVD